MHKTLFVERNLPDRILVQSYIPDYCVVLSLADMKDLAAMLTVTEADSVLIGPSADLTEIGTVLKSWKNIRPELRFLVFHREPPDPGRSGLEFCGNCTELRIPDELDMLNTFFEEIAEDSLKKIRKSGSGGTDGILARLVGTSPGMTAVKDSIVKFSGAPGPVLITGESGTGKEIAARLLHDLSGRSNNIFHAINAGSIPRSLSATELFGSAAGAYTGAVKRNGCFEHADGGTLFFDEIGELDADIQAELLRVLETGRVRRVGMNETKPVDVRVISATNTKLSEAVDAGEFRRDLLYRIDMFRIRIPPLRERLEDIPDLLMFFSEQLREERPKRTFEFTDSFLDRLFDYNWPGNVRELRNVFRRAVYLADDGRLTADVVDFS